MERLLLRKLPRDKSRAEPKPFVDTVCPLMQQQADAMGLPPMLSSV